MRRWRRRRRRRWRRRRRRRRGGGGVNRIDKETNDNMGYRAEKRTRGPRR
jgi:hypothetical protein